MLPPHWRSVFIMHLFFHVHTSYMLSFFLCFYSNPISALIATVGRLSGLGRNKAGVRVEWLWDATMPPGPHETVRGVIQLRTIGFVCYFWYPPLYLVLVFGHGTAEVCSYKFPLPDHFNCSYKYCFVICSIVVIAS